MGDLEPTPLGGGGTPLAGGSGAGGASAAAAAAGGAAAAAGAVAHSGAGAGAAGSLEDQAIPTNLDGGGGDFDMPVEDFFDLDPFPLDGMPLDGEDWVSFVSLVLFCRMGVWGHRVHAVPLGRS